MSKKSLTETEICDRFITPALQNGGWQLTQIRREYTFTDGMVTVRGQRALRGDRRRADYVLFYGPNLPLAVIEAKDNNHPVGGGMTQALAYAEALDLPFVFASNGDAFVFHDRTTQSGPVEQTLSLDAFPSPAELWSRYQAHRGLPPSAEPLIRQPYHEDTSETRKEPRYYQRIAIQRTIEAIARGQRRLLLTMATGTGKTYTAFQIMWRLWKSKQVKRILFLADRNVLVDQSRNNDFRPFSRVLTKVENREVNTAYEVYLALYQAISGTEESQNIYKQFSPGFFDLIIIDECHRGSAREESAWHEILDWFAPAIHLGLTATPKKTKDISTRAYFGEPIYSYSLHQGIADGFLAPYKVVRVDIDRDIVGWRPTDGMRDDLGQEIEDRIYNQRDMDKVLILNQRTRLVAARICAYLQATHPYGKTIVFCEDIDHASRMRQALANEVAQRWPEERHNTARFVAQITGDLPEAQAALHRFADISERYPVIATTSKLLTTGVDIQTCRLIVLDQRIESMIEFKQIVGRGTRIRQDCDKLWFTILDCKKATENFADPAWDGEPVIIYEPAPEDPIAPPDEDTTDDPAGDGDGDAEDSVAHGRPRFIVSGVAAQIVAERTQFYGPDGKLITESFRDYTRAALRERYHSLDEFLRRWSTADRKKAVLDELTNQGIPLDELREQVGRELDPFDLLCHVAFDRPALTRRQRADGARQRDVYARFSGPARAVLDALLDKYAEEGELPQDPALLRNEPMSKMGTVVELIGLFGGQEAYRKVVRELEQSLYRLAG